MRTSSFQSHGFSFIVDDHNNHRTLMNIASTPTGKLTRFINSTECSADKVHSLPCKPQL